MPTNNLPLARADTVKSVARAELAPVPVALYDRSLVSGKGYRPIAEKSGPAFRATAERLPALNARHADRLAALLFDQGVMPEPDGSMMGMGNQAVVTFRACFDDIDEDVMDQLRSGEGWVLKAFDAAIAEQAEAAPTLQALRAELNEFLANTQVPE